MARVLLGILKNANGVFYARKKVPKRLEGQVARVIHSLKERQVFLKRSLGTKDAKEANVRAKPVLIEFDRIIALAQEQLAAIFPRFRSIPSATAVAYRMSNGSLVEDALNRNTYACIKRFDVSDAQALYSNLGWFIVRHRHSNSAASSERKGRSHACQAQEDDRQV